MLNMKAVLPQRRNPQLATAEGFGGRTPELTALMHEAILIGCKLSVNPNLDKFYSRRCVSPTDRKSCVRPVSPKPCSVRPLTTGPVKLAVLPEPNHQTDMVPEREGILSTALSLMASCNAGVLAGAFTGKKVLCGRNKQITKE